MCWIYSTQTICLACHAIQPGSCTLIYHRDPDCEEDCPVPWPDGAVAENPELGYVDKTECCFCTKISEPLFLREKTGQEDFVRGELERMRGLFAGRVEEKRKRRKKREKRLAKKWATGATEDVELEWEACDGKLNEGEVNGEEPATQEIIDDESDEYEPPNHQAHRPESTEQEEGDTRPTRRYETQQRQRL